MTPFSVEELIKMYTVQDMTIEEISASLGISTGTVYNRLKQNNVKIRKGMREKSKDRVRAAVRKALKGKKRPPFSEEHKRHISEAKKGRCRVFTKYGGHRKRKANGYILVYCPKHPNATSDGYVPEHTLAMEAQIGGYLPDGYIVHHKNHIRSDNRAENLEMMTIKEHARLHLEERRKNGSLRQHTVSVMNVETGDVFASVKSAAEHIGVRPTNISKACRNPEKKIGGFHWKYI